MELRGRSQYCVERVRGREGEIKGGGGERVLGETEGDGERRTMVEGGAKSVNMRKKIAIIPQRNHVPACTLAL